MANKTVRFVATKYKNQKTKVDFYTREGSRVSFKAVERVPIKEVVKFVVRSDKKGEK